MPVPVLMPQMGESIAEGTVVRWLKKVGETVDRDEPLFEISTDKVDAEIPAPASGVLSSVKVQEGEMAAVNSVVATISGTDEPTTSTDHALAAQVETTQTSTASNQAVTRSVTDKTGSTNSLTTKAVRELKSSPLVRRLAHEHDIDIKKIVGTGANGRVTKRDILQVIEKKSTTAQRVAPASIVAPGDRVEPLSNMRKKIAEHMILSRRTSAHVHSVFHVDFSNLKEIRQKKKAEYDQAGAKLTYMAFIAKAVIDAVQRHPILNASLDGDSIIYRKNINLGIAVSLEKGLIVPVIKNAQVKDILGLSKAIVDVASRARSKQLKPEEVQDGTFTITNPGQLGAQFGFPIINQPQVAILGIGTIEKRAVAVNNKVQIRTMAYLTLGFDHRLIDGVVADEFMADLKTQLENFSSEDV
jgi:2-oxoglutarate dehydrogenase E2 component (dihydrolipoamide succinyltransferase)